MSTSPFDDWDGSVRHAKRLQGELAARVVLVDDLAPLKVVVGVDVGFEEGGQITRPPRCCWMPMTTACWPSSGAGADVHALRARAVVLP